MAYARSYRKKTSVKRRPTRKYTRKSPGKTLPRFNFSRKRYSSNRRIASMLSKFSETKLSAMTRIDEQAPSAIQLGALAYQTGFVIGGIPSGWTGLNDVASMTITQGVQAGQRIGDYVYMKKSHMTLEIDMKETTQAGNLPTEFRVIVFKARRAAYPAGTTKNPGTSLFLDEVGNDFGHGSSGFNGTDLLRQPLNKRLYTIKHDYKFMLSNPLETAVASGYSGHYPCMRRFQFNLPYFKKAHFEGGVNSPTDLDFHWAVYIYARSLDKDTKADNWEANLRGNTQWADN